MTPKKAREKAEELADELYPDLRDRSNFVPMVARALLLAQAEALDELIGRFGALPAEGPLGHSDTETFRLRDALRRAAEEIK